MRLASLVAALCLLAGCGGTGAYEVEGLSLDRSGWDSTRVRASFQNEDGEPVRPDSFQVYLFDAQYDTLYAGPSRRLAVPDERLGDREQLLVEACGWFDAQTVCEQEGFRASEKRLRAQTDVTYPEEGDVEKGRYEMPITLERKRYDGNDDWERLAPEAGAVTTFLRAYVTGREGDAVRVPLSSPGSGRFRLAGHDGFSDFSYRLNTAIHEEDRAEVTFEVYAVWNGDTTRVATLERPVLPRTEGEQRADALHFAREAARQLLQRMEVDESSDAAVRLQEWNYNRIARRFDVNMELRWRADGGFFARDDTYRLRGLLQVRRGGDDVTFEREGGNRAGTAAWDSTARQPVLALDAIPPAAPRLASGSESAGRRDSLRKNDPRGGDLRREEDHDRRDRRRRRGW